MNRIDFMRALHDELDGRLPDRDVEEILSDYVAHFEEARAAGRNEDEVAAALGDPRQLARELRAETRLRQWESHHSLRNSATALLVTWRSVAQSSNRAISSAFVVTGTSHRETRSPGRARHRSR